MKADFSKNGVRFNDLAHGEIKNFCCNHSVNLDHDVLNLLCPDKNILDVFRNILVSHTRRLLETIESRFVIPGSIGVNSI